MHAAAKNAAAAQPEGEREGAEPELERETGDGRDGVFALIYFAGNFGEDANPAKARTNAEQPSNAARIH